MAVQSHFTTLSSWVLLLAKAIDSYEQDSRVLFDKAGLDHALLRDPQARFHARAVDRLWTIADKAIDDPGFGLRVASFWHPTTLHALGYSWLASANLSEAFDCFLRYVRIIDTESEGVLVTETTPEHFKIIFDLEGFPPAPVDSMNDAVLAVLLIMCRAAYGPNFRLQKVSFQHAAPESLDTFEALFQAPLEFGADQDILWIDPELVQEPLATANPELVRINNQIVTSYLSHLDRNDLGMRVRAELIEHLPGGHFSEAEIASLLHLSQRSLQRKLREQGMSFKQLLETTRKELALQYVRDPQHSFTEVAFLLGFTESSNFSRAFKRWHGKSPREFRQDSLS